MSEPWPFDPLTPFCADLILADPPWSFSLYSAAGEEKSPQAQYECMSLDAIKALPVGHLARGDCWLFLWTCAPLLDAGFDTMKAWGFTYKSRMAWRKTTVRGKVRMGPGYIVRTMHEDVLIGTIGEPARARALPSLFDGLAREHSRKPDASYSLIETFAPNAWRVELFARQRRKNWLCWGNEVGKFGEAA